MAAMAVRGQRMRSRSDWREAIVPMVVAEQRQRLWHPFRWDSTIVYSEYSEQGTKAVFPLTSRCDLYKKKRADREDAFMLPEGTVERLRGRAQWHLNVGFGLRCDNVVLIAG